MASTSAPPRRPLPPPRPEDVRSARRRTAELRALRRSLVLLLATLLVPGSAQLAVGSRRVGRVAVRVWLGLVVLGLLVWWLVPLHALVGLAVRPWVLSLFTGLAWLLGLGWAGLFVDAWRLGHPPDLRRPHRLAILGLTLLLCIGVVTPFALAARYAGAQRDLVVSLFPDGASAVASDGRLNVLLVGGDAGSDREGLRADSINVASIDAQTGRTVLLGLPRNLEKAPFPEGTAAAKAFPGGFDDLLNGTYTYGVDHPDQFPGGQGYPGGDDPGMVAVSQAVSASLDLDLHYFALVDLSGFEDLVNALGGVTVQVGKRVPLAAVNADGTSRRAREWVEPGVQTLDGRHALWFARSRVDTTDYERMERQRCVMRAMLAQAEPANVVRNFVDIAASAKSVVRTDVPQDDLSQLVDLALQARAQPLEQMALVPPLVVTADPDFDAIHDAVDEAIKASESAPAPEPTAAAVAVPAAGTSDATPEGDAGSAAADAEAADGEPAGPICSVP